MAASVFEMFKLGVGPSSSQLFLRNILLMDQMTEMMEGDSEALQALMRRLQLKESMKYGIVVLSSLPVLVIYPFLQKYFVKGMMIGAIKG